MSKTESLKKASGEIGSILGTVRKIQGTLRLVAGIANVFANFLPPPASTITRKFAAAIYDSFGTAPSTEDVVREEFAKQKKFINDKFEEQKKFIAGEFEEQRALITDVKKFLENKEYQDALILAKSVHDMIEEKQIILSRWRDATINDLNAQNLINAIDVLGSTKDISSIRQKLEKICFEGDIMKVNQTLMKNHACTNLLKIYMDINQNRDLILIGLVNVVNRSPSQRELSLSYLDVAKTRNKEIKKWMKYNILGNEYFACNLFVTKGFWSDQNLDLRVRNYFHYLDEGLLSEVKQLDPSTCEALLQTNTKEFCQCDEQGSLSYVCDPLKKCQCKPSWEGKKCSIRKPKGNDAKYLLVGSFH